MRDAAAPPIFREVMAALKNRPRDLFEADLEGAAARASGGNGHGYRSVRTVGSADGASGTPNRAGGWTGGVRPGNPWRRVLNA